MQRFAKLSRFSNISCFYTTKTVQIFRVSTQRRQFKYFVFLHNEDCSNISCFYTTKTVQIFRVSTQRRQFKYFVFLHNEDCSNISCFYTTKTVQIFCVSCRHKYNVKHIKIVVSTGMFCLTALKLFPSVAVRS